MGLELSLFIQGRKSREKNLKLTKLLKKVNKNKIFSQKNISGSFLNIHKKEFLTVFDLCSVFEVQRQLSLVFATMKASEKTWKFCVLL